MNLKLLSISWSLIRDYVVCELWLAGRVGVVGGMGREDWMQVD